MKKTMKAEEMVIIVLPFKGSFLDYTKNGIMFKAAKSFEEYKKENRIRLKCITWVEYDRLHNEYYSKRLVKTTKKEYSQAIETKTLRYHTIHSRYDVFFTERISGLIHILYVWDKELKHFYKGAKSVALSEIEIYQEIIKDIL